MRLLITGGAGFLGSTLIRKSVSGKIPYEIHATVHENRLVPDTSECVFHDIDISDEKAVSELIKKIKPSVIVHTAAKGSPDFCEFHPEHARAVNINGTKFIIDAATKIDAKLYAMSSNQVFDGENAPFSEKSTPNPLNIYGKTKFQNEIDLSTYENAVIMRPITMYGWANPIGQKNMCSFIISKLSTYENVHVTNDMFNNYLYVGQMADAILEIISQNYNLKIINVAGSEKASLASFCFKIAEEFNLDQSHIHPVPKSFFKDESPRPMDTTYDITLFNRTFHTRPLTLHEGLSAMRNAKKSVTWKKI